MQERNAMPLRKTLRRALVLAALCLAGNGWAQTPPRPPAPNCDGVQQDRDACLREAGAARQEASRGGLTQPDSATENANALARCQQLPAADQADCQARVRGNTPGASSSGSVMGGGVLRETITTVPAPPPAK